jgi:hypothetical protein
VEELYQQLVAGMCDKWYHQKESVGEHLVSKTHTAALEHMKSVDQGNMRKVTVIKNQLRTAIGIVKSKAAAVQYDARIRTSSIGQMLAISAIHESFFHQCYPPSVPTSMKRLLPSFPPLCLTQECRHIFT